MDSPSFVKRLHYEQLSGEDRGLLQAAKEASKNSHAPVSGFAVGAILQTEGGKIFMGCNVESDAFSPSSCAEVVACDKAVSEGYRKFKKIALFSHDRENRGRDTNPLSPCGRCRQKLLEFSDMDVIMASRGSKEVWVCSLSRLLPLRFRL